jgi:hypothetical protein
MKVMDQRRVNMAAKKLVLLYPEAQPITPKQKFKSTDFVGIMILRVLCDLLLSRNQPQKLADY